MCGKEMHYFTISLLLIRWFPCLNNELFFSFSGVGIYKHATGVNSDARLLCGQGCTS